MNRLDWLEHLYLSPPDEVRCPCGGEYEDEVCQECGEAYESAAEKAACKAEYMAQCKQDDEWEARLR